MPGIIYSNYKFINTCYAILIVFVLLLIPFVIFTNNKVNNITKEKEFINRFSVPQDNQSIYYKCDLTFLDKCNNHKGKKICRFKHYLDTTANKSQNEYGIWNHIYVAQNANQLVVIMKLSTYLVAITGNIKEEMLSDIYTLHGIYYEMNGNQNSIYGSCVKKI